MHLHLKEPPAYPLIRSLPGCYSKFPLSLADWWLWTGSQFGAPAGPPLSTHSQKVSLQVLPPCVWVLWVCILRPMPHAELASQFVSLSLTHYHGKPPFSHAPTLRSELLFATKGPRSPFSLPTSFQTFSFDCDHKPQCGQELTEASLHFSPVQSFESSLSVQKL